MDSQNQMVEIAPGFFVRSWDEIERAEISNNVHAGSLLIYLKTSTQAHFVAQEHVPATLKAWRKHFGINSPFAGDYPEDVPEAGELHAEVGQHWVNGKEDRCIVIATFTAMHNHPQGGQYSFDTYPPASIERPILSGERVIIYLCRAQYYMTPESVFIGTAYILPIKN